MKLTSKIAALYKANVYPVFSGVSSDFVTIVEGTDIGNRNKESFVPAKNALLSLQFAAKEIQYTGKALVYYRNDISGNSIYNTVVFKNGKPVKFIKTRRCPYDLYGQETLRKLCKANAVR